MKIRKDVLDFIDRISDRVPDSTDDVLEAIGLQRKRSVAGIILPAVGTLFLGTVVGTVVGMFLGPRFGYQLMDRMGVKVPEKLRDNIQSGSDAATRVVSGNATNANNNASSMIR